MRSRIDLVSQDVQGGTDHSIADEQVGGIRAGYRVPAKAFGKYQGRLIVSAGEAIHKQSPQCPQPIVGIVESLGNCERVCKGCGPFRAGASPHQDQH